MKKYIAGLSLVFAVALTGCKSTPTGIDAYQNVSPQKLYNTGVAQVNKRNFTTAIKQFEAIDGLYPFSPYAEKALLQSIYAYYRNDDMASAVAAADRYVHLYPRSRRADYAYYMKGVVNMRRDKGSMMNYFNLDPAKRDLAGMRDSFTDFKTLISLYPHSQYASDSQKRMIYIRDMLARHELQTAQFYFKRKAYVAAANRASYVVEHFEGAKEVEPALHVMVSSYRHLKKFDLAHDADKILKANYPETLTKA